MGDGDCWCCWLLGVGGFLVFGCCVLVWMFGVGGLGVGWWFMVMGSGVGCWVLGVRWWVVGCFGCLVVVIVDGWWCWVVSGGIGL